MTTRTDSHLATDTHTADMAILGCLEPTFRALLVDLAFDDTADWTTGAHNFDLYSGEMDALREMADLSHTQFNAVAEAAYRVAREGFDGALTARNL